MNYKSKQFLWDNNSELMPQKYNNLLIQYNGPFQKLDNNTQINFKTLFNKIKF